ncbi:MAG TPA: hypothetical protein VEU50_20100 [Archangium sp.]|nr:hypothetical protein [Archangium sp.]HYO55095.1 hypothetical protein [Archangium sp.]
MWGDGGILHSGWPYHPLLSAVPTEAPWP